MIHVHGEAGIGKTRILNEITKKAMLSGIEVLRYICADEPGKSTCTALLAALNKKLAPQFHLSDLKSITAIPMHFKRYLIVIEDVHNASKDLFSALKNLSVNTETETPVTIVSAGRNDYSVYNESYFSYLSWLNGEGREQVCTYGVQKLSDAECKQLIRAIIQGVPEIVLKRIQTASENNPFYICHYIEYLLETKLIYLLNRNTVGITNVATFAQKLYIPKSVESLLEKRYRYIAGLPNGEELQTYLLAVCFYGMEVETEFERRFFSGGPPSALDMLYKCHFLKISYNGHVEFDHENIYLYLKQILKKQQLLKKLSQIIAQNPALMEMYPNLRKATVYYYVSDFPMCRHLIQPAIDEIQAIKNISSCNLDPRYVEIYPILYRIARKIKNETLQIKTLIAWLYVALHNLSVARGSVVIEEIINRIHKDHPQNQILSITAQQLQAHLLLQSDKISQAKKILTELSACERIHPEWFDDETRFDLFDRLASVYTQENHYQVAKTYNTLSKEVAIRLNDRKLLTLSKIIEAKIEFYNDTEMALGYMYEAKSLLNEDMSVRINCHNDLGILTAKLLLNFQEIEAIKSLQTEIDAAIARATKIEYPGAIIRAHYLAAVAAYLTGGEHESLEKVDYHLNACLSDSIRNGITKQVPQIYCLFALKAEREGQPKKSVYAYFQTMLMHMRQCNQLFLGALDFTYSNVILLTNYAIFLCAHGLESELYKFLSEIKYYGSKVTCNFDCHEERQCYYTCLKNVDIFKQNYKNILKGELLFMGKAKRYPLADRYTSFYVPLGV